MDVLNWTFFFMVGYYAGAAFARFMRSPLRCRLTGRHLLRIGWAGAPRNGFRCPRCKLFISWEDTAP